MRYERASRMPSPGRRLVLPGSLTFVLLAVSCLARNRARLLPRNTVSQRRPRRNQAQSACARLPRPVRYGTVRYGTGEGCRFPRTVRSGGRAGCHVEAGFYRLDDSSLPGVSQTRMGGGLAQAGNTTRGARTQWGREGPVSCSVSAVRGGKISRCQDVPPPAPRPAYSPKSRPSSLNGTNARRRHDSQRAP